MKTEKLFSAKLKCTGTRITKSFGGWLRECERQDCWFERSTKVKKPTLSNVSRFLNDYTDFRPEPLCPHR